ncbi:MAG: 4Fe-4S dicluster domain-containing protein [Actinobacteria bacterium]|nr:4Fe-4S dicluster domain-containing protein [Actinomycetota bacterium]
MSIEDRLIEKAGETIEDLEILVGYSSSSLPLKINPAFIKDRDGINSLIFNKFCINNLATYAYSLAKEVNGKIGIVLKPCDTRSVIQLLSEELFERDKIRLIAVGCSGIVDYKKIQKRLKGQKIISSRIEGNGLKIKTIDNEYDLKSKDFYADKCCWCEIYDNPPLYDDFIENEQKLDADPGRKYADLEQVESQSLEKISAYWDEQFDHCIRCYACRNVCPLEICRERCITHLEVPYWQSQRINSDEGRFFQLIRVLHLAGRCTECGECERVCPKNIPLLKLMKKSSQIIERLFEYRAGEDLKKRAPLLTFKDVEKNIEEEKLL